MRLSKKALACSLALTLVATATGPSDVALAAKKPSISKKSVTVTVGSSKKVTVKNAKKTVKWSSSKKKVATVKASGKKKATATIKGIAQGTSVITAKVGSKKLTCKVKVKAPASLIKSVAVDPLDTSCIVLTMKKATPVNMSDISIARKTYKEGKYNYQPSVKTIATDDQITYRLYIDGRLGEGDWVKLTYNKKDVIEKQYLKKFEGIPTIVRQEKDQKSVIYADALFNHLVGNAKYTISQGSLPTGMVLNTKRGIIKGIPTQAGESTFTVSATDELGRNATSTVTYKVYDETVLFAEDQTVSICLDSYVNDRVSKDPQTKVAGSDKFFFGTDTNAKNHAYDRRITIAPNGGSGEYTFTLGTNDITGSTLSTIVTDPATKQPTSVAAASTELRIPYTITEGTHVVPITITDKHNTSLSKTVNVTINAQRYYTISGAAEDSGNAMLLGGNKILFYPVTATSQSDYVQKHSYEMTEKKSTDAQGKETVDYVWKNNFEKYTATVGTSKDANAVVGVKEGTYSAQLLPGEYIVKIYSAADDIYYQMKDHVTVGTADAACNIKAPIKFYNVSAIAAFANGDPIANTRIYFEMKEQQYEDRDFSFNVMTDEKGNFVASLPTNKYSAYVELPNYTIEVDDNGDGDYYYNKENDKYYKYNPVTDQYEEVENPNLNRYYFLTDTEVQNDSLTIQDFKISLTRYVVAGIATGASEGSEAKPLAKTEIRFYDGKGYYRSVMTSETGAYSIGLPGNTEYIARAKVNGCWHTLGKVKVDQASLPNTPLAYGLANEFNGATQIAYNATDENANTIRTDNSNGITMYSIKPSESGDYTFTSSLMNDARTRLTINIFDENGKCIADAEEKDASKVSATAELEKDKIYYISCTAENKIQTKQQHALIAGTYYINIKK